MINLITVQLPGRFDGQIRENGIFMGKTNSVIFVLIASKRREDRFKDTFPPRERYPVSKEQLSSKPAFTVKKLGTGGLGGGNSNI